MKIIGCCFTCSMAELGTHDYSPPTVELVKKLLSSQEGYRAVFANTTKETVSKILVEAGMPLVAAYRGNSYDAPVYHHLWVHPKRLIESKIRT